jgi:hypothetical protein
MNLPGNNKKHCSKTDVRVADFLHSSHLPPDVVDNTHVLLGNVLLRLMTASSKVSEDVNEYDLVLVWVEQRRVIIGPDILVRLLWGVTPLKSNSA